ncbi:MAG: DNA gyrase subunit A [Bacteroidetes bacterium ADurb.Bin302]|nr:MAG: DNA gyrase subunit A [Bacteroidetes bacterium ADurb.Bin302]
MTEEERIIKVDIEEEMRTAYIDYSMSVIVSRALPDARDGLKPVQRRVLYGMELLNNTYDKQTKKSARIVGEVMGKFHPHGDSSIYGTLVHMVQSWAMRYPLIYGQGNFGSVDGDSPAAMRYTEAKLQRLAEEMLADIDKDTVDMVKNFDETLDEPTVLPGLLPNLLVNGTTGIAVGMATNMAPHNLSDTVDAIVAYIDNNAIEDDDLISILKAPDFPTGGILYGYSGIREAYLTGRGRVVIRARVEIETEADQERLIITELPYMVNKSELQKHIALLVNEKRIEGISNIADESNHEGMRLIIDIKRDANANVVLNKLYKETALQSSFSINNIALVKGRPRLLCLRELIDCYVQHRHEIITRRVSFDLKKAQDRLHIVEGLIIASDNIDEVIAIIKAAHTVGDAIEKLIERFSLSEIQAKAIVEMRLRQLTGLSQDELHAERDELMLKIEDLNDILSRIERRMGIIKDELLSLKEKYGDERRSEIVYASEEFNPEDFYADDEMIITISHLGYIKRTPLSEYKSQNRGGVGSKGSDSRDEDFIEYIYPASMHSYMLFFTQKGRCYWLKVYEIPEGSKNSKGRAIQNMLNIEKEDKVNAFIKVKQLQDPEYNMSHYLLFCTKQGVVKKTVLAAYSRPRQNGVNAILIREDDQVIQVRLTDGNSEVIIANKNGRAIRFNESKVREMGRTATGVRGMLLDGDDDEVVGMIAINQEKKEDILVVSEKGYGKRSDLDDYRITNRGGKGVKTINITDKTGKLVTIKNVTDDNDLMIINKSGIAIRFEVSSLRIMGRATQGVRLINLEKREDEIASICKVASEAQIEDEISEELAEASKEFNKIDGISDVVSDYDVDENDEDLENNDNE